MMATLFETDRMSRRRSAGLVAACLALLAGCAVGPDYARPAGALPLSYTPASATLAPARDGAASTQVLVAVETVPANWWQLFHSPALDALVAASLLNNPSVEAAQAALRVALENALAQRGAFAPTLDASFMPSRQKVAGVLASPLSSNDYYYNLHTAQVSVSYAPDLWGGNRRQAESLTAQAESQRYQVAATRLALTANVVTAAIQEASLRGQLAATQQIVAGQTRLLEMARRQLALGQFGAADVALQEAALAAAQGAVPLLEKQLAQQRNLLAVLAGRMPADGVDGAFELADLQLPATLPLTLPSALVEQRPDVRAAEALLHAASADIGVARANRLPAVTLGVNAYGSSAASLAQLFKPGTGFWSLAGNVVQPIFDGGTLLHRQGAAQAAYDQAAAQYRSTVINAFQNVADALQAIQYDAVAMRAAFTAQRAAATSLAIARRQLQLGDISAVTVLAVEQADQQARLNFVQAQAARLADTVALMLALGGGAWDDTQAGKR